MWDGRLQERGQAQRVRPVWPMLPSVTEILKHKTRVRLFQRRLDTQLEVDQPKVVEFSRRHKVRRRG